MSATLSPGGTEEKKERKRSIFEKILPGSRKNSEASEITNATTTGSAAPKEKKKERKRDATLAEQFKLVTKKAEAETDFQSTSLNTKDKFVLLHLAQLVAPSQAKPDAVTLENELRQSPLLFASFRGDTEAVKKGLETQAVALHGDTLPTSKLHTIHLCIASGNLELVNLILGIEEFASLIEKPATNGLFPLHIACLFGLSEVVSLIVEKFNSTSVDAVATFLPYAKSGTSLAKAMEYWKTSKKPISGLTPLYCGIVSGDIKVTSLLEKANCNIKQNQSSCITSDPLALAAVIGVEKMVKHFINDLKMDVNAADENGITSLLMLAMTLDNGNICETLLVSGANIGQIDKVTGNTCLHYAISNGSTHLIKYLCNTKKETEELAVLVNACNTTQTLTPLQHLVNVQIPEEKKQKIQALLLKHGAKEKKLYSEVIKEGYLVKQGHVVKNWKTRWFSLRKDQLLYYKNIRKLKQAAGTINLKDATIYPVAEKVQNGYAFMLHDKVENKPYTIIAETEEDCKQWMDAIRYCIENFSK